jgi:hypothetical protein
MVKDVPGQEDEAALEFGIDLGLEEGEELVEDHEQLTEAQYTVFQMMQTLKGTFEENDGKVEEIMGDKGSGLIVPT